MATSTPTPKIYNLNELESLTILSSQVRDILECIVHTILFTRTFGYVSSLQEVYLDFLDVTYVKIRDQNFDEQIRKRIDFLLDSWKKANFQPAKRIICLSFDDKRIRSQLFGLSSEERVCWEQWRITLKVEHSRTSLEKDLGIVLTKTLQQIATNVDTNKNLVPPISNKDLIPFPFEISFYDPSTPPPQSFGFFASLGNIILGSTTTQ